MTCLLPHIRKYKIITQIKAYSGGGAGGVSVAVVAPRRRGLWFNHVHGPSRNLWLEHLELLPLQVLARITGLAGIHHFLRKQQAKQTWDENSNFVIKMMTNAIQISVWLISWFAANCGYAFGDELFATFYSLFHIYGIRLERRFRPIGPSALEHAPACRWARPGVTTPRHLAVRTDCRRRSAVQPPS